MRPLNFGSTITVRLPDDTRALVVAAAEREGASASDWVRRALAAVAGASASLSPMSMPATGGSHPASAGCR